MNKILIINSDLDSMALMQLLLERDGYEVKITAKKSEVFVIISHFKPALIILDIAEKAIIPKLKSSPDRVVPLILLTGYTEREVNAEAAVQDVIEKPFEFEVLKYKIAEQLRMLDNLPGKMHAYV